MSDLHIDLYRKLISPNIILGKMILQKTKETSLCLFPQLFSSLNKNINGKEEKRWWWGEKGSKDSNLSIYDRKLWIYVIHRTVKVKPPSVRKNKMQIDLLILLQREICPIKRLALIPMDYVSLLCQISLSLFLFFSFFTPTPSLSGFIQISVSD